MIVVDSSAWIAFFRGVDCEASRKITLLDDTDSVLVGDLILLELLQGARDRRHADIIERNLRNFRVVSLCDVALAVEATAHYRELRGLGITVRKTIDLIIASYCIRGDHLLLQQDRDFVPFERYLGLKLL